MNRSPNRIHSYIIFKITALLLFSVLFTCPGCKRSKKNPLPALPYATVETPAGIQEGIFEVAYTVFDPFENLVDVLVEFSNDGLSYNLCTWSPGGTPVSGLATASTGLSYTFRWNSVADSVALTSQVDTVKIRITPSYITGGGLPVTGYPGISDEFSVDNSAANSPPVVEITSAPTGTQTGNITVGYSITDAEIDSGYIEVLYKTEYTPDWQAATLISGSGGTVEGNLIVNLTCPIPPALRDVVWDSIADLGTTYAHETQIRIIGHDARTGTPADTGVFHVDNTPAPEPPVLTLVTPASPSRGLVRLEYDISDNNAETANILFQVSLDGGSSWIKSEIAYSEAGERLDNLVSGIPCLPNPQTYHVVWDSITDIGFSANYLIRFRARPESSLYGVWAETTDFAVDNSSPAGAPGAVITADKIDIQTGETINFSAMSSTGSPTTFHWDFGDGSYSAATEPAHTYDTGPGEFAVLLTVTNAGGLSDTAALAINVIEDMTDNYTELEPYRNYYETRDSLEALAAANPGLMKIYTIGYSVQGREIFVIKISDNVETDEDEPTVHFDAQHHAREVMTPEVIIDIAEQLISNYGSSSEVTSWVDNYEIYLMPCVNPDGVVNVFTTDWGIRKNANDVDPNRNYPADWGNPDGASSNPSSTTYHGPFAASEPEVQTLIAQTLRTRPVAAITFHSYSNIILYPYSGPGLTQTSQENYISQMAESMANNMTRDIGGPYAFDHSLWYGASGVTPDWMYRDIGTFCVLVEVGDAMGGGLDGFHPDYAAYHDPQVQGVRGGVVELFRYVGRGAICGHVTDADSGEPLEADISVSGFTKLNSEIRRSEPGFGSYYWLWEDGNYTVTFTLEGYAQQSHGITVASVPYVLDVQLVKNTTGNHRPTASFFPSMTNFTVGSTIFLDGTGSTDEDGDTLTYNWNFGDNETSSLPAPTHTFNRTGTHRVVLTVDDGNGGEHETWKLVHVMPVLNAPHIALQPITGTWSRDVYVDFGLKAPIPETCSIAVEYTTDGIIWYPATIAGSDGGSWSANIISSIPATTELISHYFLWDSLADLGTVGLTVVALKVVPFIPEQAYGDMAITNLFTVDNTSTNSPPSVTLSAQSPPHFNDITFSGVISDPDYESCALTIEYSLDTGGSWNPLTIASCDNGVITGNVISGLAASPAGTDYSFVWNSFADLGASYSTDIWVCATPNDSETNGASALVTGLVVNNIGLVITDPTTMTTADSSCDISWLWDSTSGSMQGNLVYEIDYAAGVGTVFFHDDFRQRPKNEWELTGDSDWHQSSETMILDRDAGGAGGIWYSGDISATEWYCSFRFRITGGPTARGLYFSFYSEPTTSQYPADGYTLEFDANYNSADPYNVRHIALLDSSGTHLCYVENNDFSDGSWHMAEVYYKNGTLLIDMDGSNVLGYWIDTPDMSHQRFGFGGRHHDGRTYYIDDVFLSEHKPVWNQLARTGDGIGTSSGTGNYTWDTSNISSGSGCVIRIRGFDGSSYKSYSYSEPFLIEHPGTPTANLTDPIGIQRYEVVLDFTLDDPTNDICSVNVEYRPDSGGSWSNATIKSSSAGNIEGSTITGLVSGTTTYTLTWDAWHDLGEVSNTGARLRLTPSDTLTGTDSETVDFDIDNTGHPGELTGFTATAVSGTTVELTWVNPAAPSLHKIVVVRSESGFPANPGDGMVVFDSTDTGFYFDNQDINNPPAFIRLDNAIDFDWDAGSPNGAIPDDHYSIRWTGAVDIPAAGPWNFHTISEDGVRLYVDGNLIIDRWVSRAASEYCGYNMLGAGRHRLVLEYFHNVGDSEAHLYYTGPGVSRSVSPLEPGQLVSFTDFSVSSGTEYFYTGFAFTAGGAFSTGSASAKDSVTP